MMIVETDGEEVECRGGREVAGGYYRSQVDERIGLLAFSCRANGGIGGRLSGIRETMVSTRVFPQGVFVTLLIPRGASSPPAFHL